MLMLMFIRIYVKLLFLQMNFDHVELQTDVKKIVNVCLIFLPVRLKNRRNQKEEKWYF